VACQASPKRDAPTDDKKTDRPSNLSEPVLAFGVFWSHEAIDNLRTPAIVLRGGRPAAIREDRV
jgi:hypothetical protein